MRCCLFPPPCCRHTGQLSLVPSFKWHSPCKRLGDLCMVVQIKSQFARSKRVFLHKLSYGFSLKRCKKRLSHLLCQRLHPWPYWCTTPRSLPPCSCTPITWEATSSPDAIELPPTPSHLFYHWNKAAVIALQASSYEVGISSPKFRFSEAHVVLLNVAVSFLNVSLWSVWSISCISGSVHDYNSNLHILLCWIIHLL